jgi:hypothetical protein
MTEGMKIRSETMPDDKLAKARKNLGKGALGV